jgi:deoxyhypusine synthase
MTPTTRRSPILFNEDDLARLRIPHPDELKFKVVADPDSWLQTCYDFLRSHFGPETLDPLQRYVDWLEMNRLGSHPFPFLLMAAYLEDGESARIVGAISGNVMRIEESVPKGAHSSPPPFIFAIGHQLTAPAVRNAGIKGVGTRLWRRAIGEAKAIARARHGRLAYSFLEAENDSVGFWDRLGYRWPQAVTYWQPPLEFDENGDFVHPEVPEIALLKPLEVRSKRAIERRLLHDIVATVYVNWALSRYRGVLSPEAMKRAESYVLGSLLGRVDSRMPDTPHIGLVRIQPGQHHVRSMALSQGIQHHLSPLRSPSSSSIGDFDGMLVAMRDMAFGARTLGQAADVLYAMASDPQCQTVLTLSGAATIAKLDTLIAEMIERGLVHCIVSTGAAMCHGFNAERGSEHFKLPEKYDDTWLFEQGYDRIFDTIEMEYALDELQDILHGLLAKRPAKGVLCSSDITRMLGEYLKSHAKNKGVIGAAHACGVPVFIPAFTDSELGLDFALFNRRRRKEGRKGLSFDPFIDFERYCHFMLGTKTRGIVSLGGGVPRNWAQQVGPFMDAIERRENAIAVKSVRFKYGVRICPDPPYWGGLSGATYSEGVSWGKFIAEEEGGKVAEVYSDYTFVFPLLVKGLFQRLDKAKGRERTVPEVNHAGKDRQTGPAKKRP